MNEPRQDNSPTQDLLHQHQEELLATLEAVSRDTALPSPSSTRLRQYPPRLATHLWFALKYSGPVPAACRFSGKPGDAIRRLHDFYGWKAGGGLTNRGLCSGAIYRTADFLRLPTSKRDGRRANKTVHIEHTVPCAALVEFLRREIIHLDSPLALHDSLMSYSLCTAFTCEEEKAMKGVIDRAVTPAFTGGKHSGNYPFLRYERFLEFGMDFHIHNVVTGEEVLFDKYTFTNHRETLIQASTKIGLGVNGAPDLFAARYFDSLHWAHHGFPLQELAAE